MNESGAVRVEAPRVDVVDVCGAGATFSAGYIDSLLNGRDFERSLKYAVAARVAEMRCGRPRRLPARRDRAPRRYAARAEDIDYAHPRFRKRITSWVVRQVVLRVGAGFERGRGRLYAGGYPVCTLCPPASAAI